MVKKQSSKKKSKKSSKKNQQRGGAYYLGVQQPRLGGLTQVVGVDDRLPTANSINAGHSYPVPLYLQQKGGAYSYITNPLTNRKVKVSSALGKNIINQYKRQLGGAAGELSIFDDNMLNRDFATKQPYWSPKNI